MMAPERPGPEDEPGVTLGQGGAVSIPVIPVFSLSSALMQLKEGDAAGNILTTVKVEKAGAERSGSEDDDLTSLSWLQDKNLLKGINLQVAVGEAQELPTSDFVDDSASEVADSTCSSGNSLSPLPSSSQSSSPSKLKHPQHMPYDPLLLSGLLSDGPLSRSKYGTWLKPDLHSLAHGLLVTALSPQQHADSRTFPKRLTRLFTSVEHDKNKLQVNNCLASIHVHSKPPYSFSCLIFMAIEDSPSKALPVKEIYSWILDHFPYFCKAPTGWKNSVRHNLSLNKCFRKVEKAPVSLHRPYKLPAENLGKGSLWMVDPVYRPNLVQALKKAPFHPYSSLERVSVSNKNRSSGSPHRTEVLVAQGNTRLPNPDLFPFLSRRLAASTADTTCLLSDMTPDDDVNAAAAMLALKHGNRMIAQKRAEWFRRIQVQDDSTPVLLDLRKKKTRASKTPQGGSNNLIPVITTSPSEDHTYSAGRTFTSTPAQQPLATTSPDEAFEEGSESNEGSSLGGEPRPVCLFPNMSLVKGIKSSSSSSDTEEQRKIAEGADALLNLAGISTRKRSHSQGEYHSDNNSSPPYSMKRVATRGRRKNSGKRGLQRVPVKKNVAGNHPRGFQRRKSMKNGGKLSTQSSWTLDLGPWTLDLGPWTLEFDTVFKLFEEPAVPDLYRSQRGENVTDVYWHCLMFAQVSFVHVLSSVRFGRVSSHSSVITWSRMEPRIFIQGSPARMSSLRVAEANRPLDVPGVGSLRKAPVLWVSFVGAAGVSHPVRSLSEGTIRLEGERTESRWEVWIKSQQRESRWEAEELSRQRGSRWEPKELSRQRESRWEAEELSRQPTPHSPFTQMQTPPSNPYPETPPSNPYPETPPSNPYSETPPSNPYPETPPFNPYHETPPSNPYHETPPFNPYHETPPSNHYPETPPSNHYPETPPSNPYPETPPSNPYPETPPSNPYPETPPSNPYPETPPSNHYPETPPFNRYPETPPFNPYPETPQFNPYPETPPFNP
uniref:Fork-head domain-containing protein n=1 Tax=Timema shepardi TaxID=629360 RepID=A0A7R9G197_TIMSH|nr:unnamed protein product [Timema shepardi]